MKPKPRSKDSDLSLVHQLKTVQPYYGQVVNGLKTFDMRRADRDFQKGDILVLREYDLLGKLYSGSYILRSVGFTFNASILDTGTIRELFGKPPTAQAKYIPIVVMSLLPIIQEYQTRLRHELYINKRGYVCRHCGMKFKANEEPEDHLCVFIKEGTFLHG